jgi:hypothetical protein
MAAATGTINQPTPPFWIQFSSPGQITGWHYFTPAKALVGPFATRAEAEQHAKEAAP